MNQRSSFVRSNSLVSIIGAFVIFFALIPLAHIQADVCTMDIAGKSRSQLAIELDACNAEIDKWTNILNNTKKDSASYANDVAYLTAKINAAQANIKAKNIAITNLGKNIVEKEAKITALDNRIEEGRNSLGELIRKTKIIDDFSLAETVLSSKNLSDFFADVEAYSATQKAMAVVFAELRGIKVQTQSEKEALKKQREAEAAAKAAIELAKKEVEVSQAQKKVLLAESKNKEVTYGKVLADRQAKAAQIRAALFPLQDAGPIQFGIALKYATAAGIKTGVRPALILAILQKETDMGANVGRCNRAIDPPEKRWNMIMPGPIHYANYLANGKSCSGAKTPCSYRDDQTIFKQIVSNLGRDLNNTPLSCPLSIGYGGGMGPTQFIPTTWNLINNKVASALNRNMPDPWNAEDAIWASAFLLSSNGASVGTYAAERTAACKYYGGGKSCTSTTAAYGNDVLAKAAKIQTTMIDPLQGI